MHMEKGPEKASSLEDTPLGVNSPANLMRTLSQSCFPCLQPHLPFLCSTRPPHPRQVATGVTDLTS